MKHNKSIGIGSLSIVIFFIAIIFSFSTRNIQAVGDLALNSMGFEAWSKESSGFHYTIIVSIGLFIFAWIIGNKYKNNFGAVFGKTLSLWFGLLLAATMLLNI